jgi:hypothetical protein
MNILYIMSKNITMIKMHGGYILGLRTIFLDVSFLVTLVTHFVTLFHKYGIFLCKSIFPFLGT